MGELLPSKKQHELLSFIEGFIKENGYGPSYREVMRALDYKSVSTVAVHIDGLIARGYLVKRDRSARSLEVVNSHISGNPVEKPTDTAAHEWIAKKASDQINVYMQSRADEDLRRARTLIDALAVLELHDIHARMSAKLAKATD